MPAPPAAAAQSSGMTRWLAGALLLTNALTLIALWHSRRRIDSSDAAPSRPRETASSASLAATVSPTEDIDEDDASTAASSSAFSRPNGQIFTSEHIAFAVSSRPQRVTRVVQCRDTNEFLQGVRLYSSEDEASSAPVGADAASFSWHNCSMLTSIPDVSETGLALAAWEAWFQEIIVAMIQRLPPSSVLMLYQTDVTMEGRWVSKATLAVRAAERTGAALVWHKIVVVRSLRSIRGSTAGYTHLLCFSRAHVQPRECVRPDLLPSRGPMLWPRAMGLRAADFAVEYVRRHVAPRFDESVDSSRLHTVVDPFCGSGSLLATANAHGLNSLGVDHSRKRCKLAHELSVQRVLDELRKDAEATAAAEAAGAVGAAAASVSAFEQEQRVRRQARKEERRALGLSQKQWQLKDRDTRRAQFNKDGVISAQPASSTEGV